MGVMGVARRLMFATVVSLCSMGIGVLVSTPVALAATPPVIEEESVLEVAGTSATLQAKIDPEGNETTYRFEYGTSERYGSSMPVPDGLVGAGSSGVTVTVHVQGLSASTGYHYRVVASVPSRRETLDGADGTFFTQSLGAAFALPDNRQWELVSPPNKHGALIGRRSEGIFQSSEDGSAMTYYAYSPTELEPRAYAGGVQLFSTRGLQGWSSVDIATPHSAATGTAIGQGLEYRFFSSDLSLGLLEPQGPFTQLTPDETERTPDIRHDSTCEASPSACYTPLVMASNTPPGTKFGGNPEYSKGEAQFIDATPDLSHVVIRSGALTTTPGDEGGLYEWSAGQIQLVDILPEGEGGKPVPAGEDVALSNAIGETLRRAISNDGSRIFWTAGPHIHLYMRDMAKRETVRIGGEGEAIYQTASSDGSSVFFIARPNGQVSNLEVCEFTEVAGKLACDTRLLAPEAVGVVEASEDGSSVYFISRAALAPGAMPGGFNLYFEHRNEASWESPKLVAVLTAKDTEKAYPLNGPGNATARLSPDGKWLTFMSQNDLTGYDNRDVASGQPDEEVYLYDSETGKLSCVSCNPTQARPAGVESLGSAVGQYVVTSGEWEAGTWLAANIPGWTPYALSDAVYQSRYLSDSGRMFFNGHDALVPQDVNGTWDVYEFEPAGVGDCTVLGAGFNPSTGGCVSLISSGTSPEESGFMEASANGDDVFFVTDNRLVSEDFDTAFDIYDAHSCSAAVPCRPTVVSAPPCTTGDACKPPPSPQPAIFGSPASATFSGAGNVTVSSEPSVSSRSLTSTMTQKLARALRACNKKPKRKRAACKRSARKRYQVKQSRNAKPTTKGKR
jgi:hypothetical protein